MMQFTLPGDFSALANQTKAVMVFVETHENHPTPYHAIGIHVGDLEAEYLGVELNRGIDVSDHQDSMSQFADLERHISRRLNAFQCLNFGIVQPVQIDLAQINSASFHFRSLPM
jgi:hypothetical protein